MTERIGGIVLAGGRSSRFGRDKLAEPVGGRPLLHHAIEAVRAVATDIVVVTGPDADTDLPDGVRLAHDPVAFEGPLAGLAAGLAALDPGVDRVVVVAGDMPSLMPAVLRRLLDTVASGPDAAILGRDGDTPPLPLALRRRRAQAAVGTLLDAGERRMRALPRVLDAEVIQESTWRLDDPAAATLRDIDTPEDLPPT
jgi:molybdopterin-guanine dinucleotide biosynthesis protein A